MDRQRHRLLTENVSYFQKCLTVTRDLLKTCVYQGVFREEEEQLIWVRINYVIISAHCNLLCVVMMGGYQPTRKLTSSWQRCQMHIISLSLT